MALSPFVGAAVTARFREARFADEISAFVVTGAPEPAAFGQRYRAGRK